MGRILKPMVRGGGWYPSNKWIPLVKNGGYTTQSGGGDEPEPPTPEVWKTITGSIVSFVTSVAYPMKSLVAQIEPQQDLHGYDAPWAGGAGKNLLNLDFTNDSGTVAGMTFTHGESYITLKGTASGTSYATFNLRTPIPADLNTDYTYSLTISGTCPGGLYGIEFKNGATLVQRFRCNTTDATSKTLQISSAFDSVTFNIEGLTSGLVFDCEIKIQFEKGSSKTAWQTYSNICPISGWTGLSGQRDGKNLINHTQNESGGIDASGNEVSGTTFRRSSNYIPIKPNTSFALWANNNWTVRLYFYDANKNFIPPRKEGGTGGEAIATSPSNAYFARWSVYNAGTAFTNDDIINSQLQLEVGSSATAYEPYITPTTITCTWQTEAGTVYDGYIDVVSGLLTAEVGKYNVTGTEDVQTQNGYFRLFRAISGAREDATKTICSDYPVASTFSRTSMYLAVNASGQGTVYFPLDESSRFADITAFKAYLASRYQANNPVEIIYPLAEAQTYQLTPQQISTLLGNNTVFVDTGDVEVTYRES